MTSPFFLTRQSANLMEDFTRELKAGAALFLLYGESGVGKTRLLQELSQNRLADRSIRWLDLSEDNNSDDSMPDHGREVETVFASAQQGDIIITDHFEKALKKARHQLFLSWSTDGVDKRLNLIIASSTEGFNELRQLSQQYQVPVQSFQQMPFNADEVNAFVGFSLFPDRPIGKLSIPTDLRKQLAATQGAVGGIIEIIERDGARIGSSSMNDTGSIRRASGVVVTVLILFVLTVGGGWYYFRNHSEMFEAVPEFIANETEPKTVIEPVAEPEIVAQPEVEPASVVIVEPKMKAAKEQLTDAELKAEAAKEQLTDAELKAEAAKEQLTDAELKAEPTKEQLTDAQPETSPVSEPEVIPEVATEIEPEAGIATETVAQVSVNPEPGTASDTEAVIVEKIDSGQQETALTSMAPVSTEQGQIESPGSTRLQRELKMSHDWITGKAESIGTLQILLLGFKSFDEVAYYEYIDSLASKQVDITKIRIFKTYTGSAEVYSVFFGEYASRKAAFKAKDALPEVIRKISPIPRSVGGILQEIRRLEAES